MSSETLTRVAARSAAPATARRPAPSLPRPLLVVAAVAAISLVVAVGAGVPARDLVRDPAPYLGTPLHVGLLSTLGVLMWAAAAGLALLASLGDRSLRLYAGLSALCAVDDAFLLHEEVWPRLSRLPEVLALLPYAVLGVLVLRRLPALEAKTRAAFAVAIVAQGASVGLDLVGSPLALVSGTADDVRNLAEELVKLAGITLWLTACWSLAAGAVRPRSAGPATR
jgi:hypothetical protein